MAKNVAARNRSGRETYETDIQGFYNGANVLITGATGFVGKVLLEKLLRSCPGISSIYLLVRKKDEKDGETRINEMFQKSVFEKLWSASPGFRKKIIVIEGDISAEGLGVSPEDRQLLMQRVNVVFHLAAATSPDESLKNAVLSNVRGTKDLLQLCGQCPRLKGMVFMSTAFCHFYRSALGEEFYKVTVSDKMALELVENMEEDWLQDITPRLVGAWPNTYTLTKGIAEGVVNTYGGSLPVGVFRSSTVVSTNAEPISGWIDNPRGIMAGVLALSLGRMRTARLSKDCVADLVPCDMVANALIVAAWDVHERKRLGDEQAVYNFVSSFSQPITWDELAGLIVKHSWHTPSTAASWAVSFTPVLSPVLYWMLVLLLHLLPALLADVGLLLSGHKTKMLNRYRHQQTQLNLYSKVCNQTWIFNSGNVDRLRSLLSEQDSAKFDFNPKELDWEEFVKNCLVGLRTYILGESPLTLSKAIKKRNRLYMLHQLIKISLLCIFVWLFWLAARAILIWTETTDVGVLIINRISGHAQMHNM
ncbi:fatty acyl-CoA reductase wat-like [Periplaneta americana]|uniref:fatty acyl-CoA reductase wat-like n=1 Tax=Periplaneta americana TaxID=6978 RepID=UPI0037E8A326